MKILSGFILSFLIFSPTPFPIDLIPPPTPSNSDQIEKNEVPEPDNPYEAFRWRRLAWLDRNGNLDQRAYFRALQKREANEKYWSSVARFSTASFPKWKFRGPKNVGGRTRSLLIDPRNHDVLIAGSVSGGIWRSKNGGASWKRVDDRMPSLAIGSLAYDPKNPDIVYAGTGECNGGGDYLTGVGIFKSTNAGKSWTHLAGTENFGSVCRISVSPNDSNIMLAAIFPGGIIRSSNAGATWSNVLSATQSWVVEFNPKDGNQAIGHKRIFPDAHQAVYSTDAGLTWQIASGVSNLPRSYGAARIELRYAPGDPNIVYAVVGDKKGNWRSNDGGKSYSKISTTSPEISAPSWYNIPLWIDPTDPNTIVTGGSPLFRSRDGGKSFTDIGQGGYILTQAPHVDYHVVTHDPGFNGQSNRAVYVCTDGGCWKTNDIYNVSKPAEWQRRDITYNTSQYYGAAGHQNGLIIGGTQDNGTLRIPPGSKTATLMFGGDGGFAAISRSNPNICFGEFIGLSIVRSRDGGRTANYIYSGIADTFHGANFVAPFILDPNDDDVLLAGGLRLWRTYDASSSGAPRWTAISPKTNPAISAIAVATGNSNIIWIGRNNGILSKTSNGTAALPRWENVKNPNPNVYVTRIVIDPKNSNTVYVASGGFTGNNLWKSTDSGRTWKDITGNGLTSLPAAPIRGFAQYPSNQKCLYAGTEVGIFSSNDGGLTWSTNQFGPSSVSMDELVFIPGTTKLLAATHGRGIWTADVACP